MPTTRTLHGIKTLSYTYREVQALRLGDIQWYPGLERTGNYERANRYGSTWGAAPQLGGAQHVAVTAEFLQNNTPDQSAENVTAWGLNPANKGASWNDCIDRDTYVPLLPTWTRPWQHGVSGAPKDLNSILVGQEMGILGTDWRIKPDWFVLAQLRMSAAVWAMYVAKLGWPLEVIHDRAEVYRRISAGRKVGFTEHYVLDNANRNDAGQVGTSMTTTFPWHKRHSGGPGLLPLIREELAVKAGPVTPPPSVKAPAGSLWKVTADALNARAGAGTTYDVIGTAPKGTFITATGKTSGMWLQGQTIWQKANNVLAWWHSDHLDETTAPPKPEPAPVEHPAPTLPAGSRIAGPDRYATSAAAYRAAPATLRQTVYLAAGNAPTLADALSAPPDGCVLLVRAGQATLPGPVAAALAEHRPTTIRALGTTDLVTDAAVLAARAAAGITT